MSYRGIIFDFNGVLFWDADLQVRSWQVIARNLRGRAMTDDEFATHMHGRPNSYVLSYLAGRTIVGPELLSLIEAKESFFRELCLADPARLRLSPGAQDLLEWLKHRGIPHTIATSSEVTNLRFFTEHLRLDQWFDAGKIIYDDGTQAGKPAPDMYLAAAGMIGVAPGDCVVVEDALSGVAAAHAADIGYIVALGPTETHPSLLACAGVAVAIRSLEEFPRERLVASV